MEQGPSGGSIVIVGAGPAGVRVAEDILKLAPQTRIEMFGAEQSLPYDRVRLSSVLAGECKASALDTGNALLSKRTVRMRLGESVVGIDRERQQVTSSTGERIAYRHLVIATGSKPHVPSIPGTQLPGVFTFRDMHDAEKLVARRMRSRFTVVLGGGLLGLEAARAMLRYNTKVLVIEHGGRLMPRQLDDSAGALLADQIRAAGVQVVVDDGVVEIMGNASVEEVRLRSGIRVPCDTVIVATGIVPNVNLALDAGLPINRGIKVDDELRTMDANIFAVGECAEHRGVVYGLVAPCLEQASVVANLIAGQSARYQGSTNSTRLKVVKTPVFAAGTHPQDALSTRDRELVYRDDDSGVYRKLVHAGGGLHGVLGIGEWNELPRVIEATTNHRRIGFIQRWRFQRTGRLWASEEAQSVAQWPANATICNCAGVTRGQLTAAMASGCQTRAALAAQTRASTVCGSCIPLVEELVGGASARVAAGGWGFLMATAILSGLIALAIAFLPDVPYVESWAAIGHHWDVLWRDRLFKQISGFSLLGMGVFGLALSLRKRVPRLSIGGFSFWRNLHVALGALALIALLMHTGGRMGSGLNASLMIVFLLLVSAGVAAGLLISFEHRLSPAFAKRVRGGLTLTHIVGTWPLPVLLGFHVLKTYYF